MILTVTLNPALDITYTVDELRPHRTHRVETMTERAGGKGVNVARVLQSLGEPVVATGLCGGAIGDRLRDLLAVDPYNSGIVQQGPQHEPRIPDAFVPIAGESRRTVVVADAVDSTGFWERGPQVTPGEWDAFLVRYRGLVTVATVAVLSGSLPLGVPDGAYGELVEIARAAGVPTILDTSGPALAEAVTAGPDVVKPNAEELAELVGRKVTGPDDARGAADAVRALGARAVVVSLGPDGLLACTPDGGWRVPAPEDVAGNPTGAGDATVAALARGLAAGTSWPEVLADAVALSAASVATPTAGTVHLPMYLSLRQSVRALPVPH